MRGVFFGIGLAAALLVASAAAGAQCGFERCWGAVAIGPDGEWAWSKGYVVEAGAIARIQNQCPGCTEIETFYNGCAVIAQADTGAWGFGWGDTQVQAERVAVTYCTQFAINCEPMVWACSY